MPQRKTWISFVNLSPIFIPRINARNLSLPSIAHGCSLLSSCSVLFTLLFKSLPCTVLIAKMVFLLLVNVVCKTVGYVLTAFCLIAHAWAFFSMCTKNLICPVPVPPAHWDQSGGNQTTVAISTNPKSYLRSTAFALQKRSPNLYDASCMQSSNPEVQDFQFYLQGQSKHLLCQCK